MTAFLLGIIHKLEGIRMDCMNAKEWEAAHALDTVVELLRKQLELNWLDWENRYRK
jgi:hypothetical protein